MLHDDLIIYMNEEDITNGPNIVGTGTISSDGTVGEIGGVKYKVLAANKKKADIFLCPVENYEEAIKVKNKEKMDIKVVGVGTFDEAISELSKLK